MSALIDSISSSLSAQEAFVRDARNAQRKSAIEALIASRKARGDGGESAAVPRAVPPPPFTVLSALQGFGTTLTATPQDGPSYPVPAALATLDHRAGQVVASCTTQCASALRAGSASLASSAVRALATAAESVGHTDARVAAAVCATLLGPSCNLSAHLTRADDALAVVSALSSSLPPLVVGGVVSQEEAVAAPLLTSLLFARGPMHASAMYAEAQAAVRALVGSELDASLRTASASAASSAASPAEAEAEAQAAWLQSLLLPTATGADAPLAGAPLLTWLQAHSKKETAAMRRRGLATFPGAELPALVACLWHTGAVTEAREALAQLQAGAEAVTLKPSPVMQQCWTLVITVRSVLRDAVKAGKERGLAAAEAAAATNQITADIAARCKFLLQLYPANGSMDAEGSSAGDDGSTAAALSAPVPRDYWTAATGTGTGTSGGGGGSGSAGGKLLLLGRAASAMETAEAESKAGHEAGGKKEEGGAEGEEEDAAAAAATTAAAAAAGPAGRGRSTVNDALAAITREYQILSRSLSTAKDRTEATVRAIRWFLRHGDVAALPRVQAAVTVRARRGLLRAVALRWWQQAAAAVAAAQPQLLPQLLLPLPRALFALHTERCLVDREGGRVLPLAGTASHLSPVPSGTPVAAQKAILVACYNMTASLVSRCLAPVHAAAAAAAAPAPAAAAGAAAAMWLLAHLPLASPNGIVPSLRYAVDMLADLSTSSSSVTGGGVAACAAATLHFLTLSRGAAALASRGAALFLPTTSAQPAAAAAQQSTLSADAPAVHLLPRISSSIDSDSAGALSAEAAAAAAAGRLLDPPSAAAAEEEVRAFSQGVGAYCATVVSAAAAAAVAPPGSPAAAACARAQSVLLAVAQVPLVRSLATLMGVPQALLRIFLSEGAALEVRAGAAALLRSLATSCDPSLLDSTVTGAVPLPPAQREALAALLPGSGATPGQATALRLMLVAAAPSAAACGWLGGRITVTAPPQALQQLASDAVTVMRTLLTLTGWHTAIQALVLHLFTSLSGPVSGNALYLPALVGACAVCGGFTEPRSALAAATALLLPPGAAAHSIPEHTLSRVIVLAMDEAAGTATVCFPAADGSRGGGGGGAGAGGAAAVAALSIPVSATAAEAPVPTAVPPIGEIEEVEIARLVPVSRVEPLPSAVIFSSDALAAMRAVLECRDPVRMAALADTAPAAAPAAAALAKLGLSPHAAAVLRMHAVGALAVAARSARNLPQLVDSGLLAALLQHAAAPSLTTAQAAAAGKTVLADLTRKPWLCANMFRVMQARLCADAAAAATTGTATAAAEGTAATAGPAIAPDWLRVAQLAAVRPFHALTALAAHGNDPLAALRHAVSSRSAWGYGAATAAAAASAAAAAAASASAAVDVGAVAPIGAHHAEIRTAAARVQAVLALDTTPDTPDGIVGQLHVNLRAAGALHPSLVELRLAGTYTAATGVLSLHCTAVAFANAAPSTGSGASASGASGASSADSTASWVGQRVQLSCAEGGAVTGPGQLAWTDAAAFFSLLAAPAPTAPVLLAFEPELSQALRGRMFRLSGALRDPRPMARDLLRWVRTQQRQGEEQEAAAGGAGAGAAAYGRGGRGGRGAGPNEHLFVPDTALTRAAVAATAATGGRVGGAGGAHGGAGAGAGARRYEDEDEEDDDDDEDEDNEEYATDSDDYDDEEDEDDSHFPTTATATAATSSAGWHMMTASREAGALGSGSSGSAAAAAAASVPAAAPAAAPAAVTKSVRSVTFLLQASPAVVVVEGEPSGQPWLSRGAVGLAPAALQGSALPLGVSVESAATTAAAATSGSGSSGGGLVSFALDAGSDARSGGKRLIGPIKLDWNTNLLQTVRITYDEAAGSITFTTWNGLVTPQAANSVGDGAAGGVSWIAFTGLRAGALPPGPLLPAVTLSQHGIVMAQLLHSSPAVYFPACDLTSSVLDNCVDIRQLHGAVATTTVVATQAAPVTAAAGPILEAAASRRKFASKHAAAVHALTCPTTTTTSSSSGVALVSLPLATPTGQLPQCVVTDDTILTATAATSAAAAGVNEARAHTLLGALPSRSLFLRTDGAHELSTAAVTLPPALAAAGGRLLCRVGIADVPSTPIQLPSGAAASGGGAGGDADGPASAAAPAAAAAGPEVTFEIGFEGGKHNMSVPESFTVLNLKEKIQATFSVPVSTQKLLGLPPKTTDASVLSAIQLKKPLHKLMLTGQRDTALKAQMLARAEAAAERAAAAPAPSNYGGSGSRSSAPAPAPAAAASGVSLTDSSADALRRYPAVVFEIKDGDNIVWSSGLMQMPGQTADVEVNLPPSSASAAAAVGGRQLHMTVRRLASATADAGLVTVGVFASPVLLPAPATSAATATATATTAGGEPSLAASMEWLAAYAAAQSSRAAVQAALIGAARVYGLSGAMFSSAKAAAGRPPLPHSHVPGLLSLTRTSTAAVVDSVMEPIGALLSSPQGAALLLELLRLSLVSAPTQRILAAIGAGSASSSSSLRSGGATDAAGGKLGVAILGSGRGAGAPPSRARLALIAEPAQEVALGCGAAPHTLVQLLEALCVILSSQHGGGAGSAAELLHAAASTCKQGLRQAPQYVLQRVLTPTGAPVAAEIPVPQATGTVVTGRIAMPAGTDLAIVTLDPAYLPALTAAATGGGGATASSVVALYSAPDYNEGSRVAFAANTVQVTAPTPYGALYWRAYTPAAAPTASASVTTAAAAATAVAAAASPPSGLLFAATLQPLNASASKQKQKLDLASALRPASEVGEAGLGGAGDAAYGLLLAKLLTTTLSPYLRPAAASHAALAAAALMPELTDALFVCLHTAASGLQSREYFSAVAGVLAEVLTFVERSGSGSGAGAGAASLGGASASAAAAAASVPGLVTAFPPLRAAAALETAVLLDMRELAEEGSENSVMIVRKKKRGSDRYSSSYGGGHGGRGSYNQRYGFGGRSGGGLLGLMSRVQRHAGGSGRSRYDDDDDDDDDRPQIVSHYGGSSSSSSGGGAGAGADVGSGSAAPSIPFVLAGATLQLFELVALYRRLKGGIVPEAVESAPQLPGSPPPSLPLLHSASSTGGGGGGSLTSVGSLKGGAAPSARSSFSIRVRGFESVLYNSDYKRLGQSFPTVPCELTFPLRTGVGTWRFVGKLVVAPVLASNDEAADDEGEVVVHAGTASTVQPLHLMHVSKTTSVAGELQAPPGVLMLTGYDCSNDSHMTKVKLLCKHIVKYPAPATSLLLPVPSLGDDLALRKLREAAHAMNSAWSDLDQASAGLARPSFVVALDSGTEELLALLQQALSDVSGSAAAAAPPASPSLSLSPSASASTTTAPDLSAPLTLAAPVAPVLLFPELAHMGIVDAFNSLNGTARLLTAAEGGDQATRSAAYNMAWYLVHGRTAQYAVPALTAGGGSKEWHLHVPGSETLLIRWDTSSSSSATAAFPPGCTVAVTSPKGKVLPAMDVHAALAELFPVTVKGSHATVTLTWPQGLTDAQAAAARGLMLQAVGQASNSPPAPVRQRLIAVALANQLGPEAGADPAATLAKQLRAFCDINFLPEGTGGLNVDERLLPLSERCITGVSYAPAEADEEALQQLGKAAGVAPSILRIRCVLLRLFADTYRKLAAAVAGGGSGGGGMSVSPLSLVRGVPLQRLKRLLGSKDGVARLQRLLAATNCGGGGAGLSLSLLDSIQDGEAAIAAGAGFDVAKSKSLFAQTWRQMNSLPSTTFRTSGRLLSVSYVDEAGIDAGGVYRETLSRLADELCGSPFPLFVPSPRDRDRHTHEFIPNAALTSPTALSMYEFVGRLLGFSMRSSSGMPFAFPSLVWQALVGDEPDFEDLLILDPATANLVHRLMFPERTADAEGTAREPLLRPEDFAEAFKGLTFTALGANGAVVELLPGGADTAVDYDNRTMYAELLTHRRLHEFDVQLAAVRRGFGAVVPLSAMAVLSWRDAERLVCGDPNIDAAYLRSHTGYSSPYSDKHPVIRRFWRAFDKLTQEERSGLVRFGWGRSRLPEPGTTTWQFRLDPLLYHHAKPPPEGAGGNLDAPWPPSPADAYLAEGHTCFNSISLPPYSSDEVMLKQLRIAILYGSKSLGQA